MAEGNVEDFTEAVKEAGPSLDSLIDSQIRLAKNSTSSGNAEADAVNYITSYKVTQTTTVLVIEKMVNEKVSSPEDAETLLQESNRIAAAQKAGQPPPADASPEAIKLNDTFQGAVKSLDNSVKAEGGVEKLEENAKTNSWLQRNMELIKVIIGLLTTVGTGIAGFLVYEDIVKSLQGCYKYYDVNGQTQKLKVSCSKRDLDNKNDQPNTCGCDLVPSSPTCTGAGCYCASPSKCGGPQNVNYVWEDPSILDVFSAVIGAATKALGDGLKNIVSPLGFSGIFEYILFGVGGLICVYIFYKIVEHYMSQKESKENVLKIEPG